MDSKEEKQATIYIDPNVGLENSDMNEPEPDFKPVANSSGTFKELDFQSIFKIIASANYKGENKESKEKLVKDLNSIIQKEGTNGIEAFGFDTIKTFILQVASLDMALKEVANKIIEKLKEAY